MTLRNVTLERREKTRTVPNEFAFLQLEKDDGGTVLDISEGGLRFESFAPIQEHGPIHFWFSLNLRERIEAWGEVAWTDAERKSGGLKFLSLSEGGRDQIREYIARSSPQEAPAKLELAVWTPWLLSCPGPVLGNPHCSPQSEKQGIQGIGIRAFPSR